MKKWICAVLAVWMMGAVLVLPGCGKDSGSADNALSSGASEAGDAQNGVTADMAFEGVSNYCHAMYDWSVAEENPGIMGVTMGEETDAAYQVIFRSFTGAFVYFSVEKASGRTTMTEVVPALNVESEAGEFSIYDYLPQSN